MGMFRWSVRAGDQIGHSEDDKKCGDHYISKDLECHDGDAHRPTPGKNPYWQSGRKGPPSEDSGGKEKPRDREKLSKRAEEKKERREKEPTPKTPEDYARNTLEDLKKQVEDAFEEQGQELVWDDRRKHELMEMVMRDTAREFSLDPEELGMFDPERPYFSLFHGGPWPDRGYKGRSLWRPRQTEEPTTTPRDKGREEAVPPEFESKKGPGLYQKMKDVFEDKQQDERVASRLNWSVSKIVQDRAEQPEHKGCPDEGKLLALDSALPELPGDSAQGRPCGDDEKYPDKCSMPGGRPSPSDDPKFLQRGKQAKPGIGLGPTEDPQRAQRTSQHVQNLKRIDPSDTKKTAWAMDKMFGSKGKPSKDGGIVGGGRTSSPEQAKQTYDDARHSLEQAGWQQTSDMPGQSTYSKGSANISLRTDRTGTAYKLHAPPKKRGLLGHLNWAIAKLPFPGAAPPFGSEDDEAESDVKTEHSGSKKGKGAWHGRKKEAKQVSKKKRRQADKQAATGTLASQLDWSTTGRPCGEDEKYPDKCTGPIGVEDEDYGTGPEGGGWLEDIEREWMPEEPSEEVAPEESLEPVAPSTEPEWHQEGVHEFWSRPREEGPGKQAVELLRKKFENALQDPAASPEDKERAQRFLQEGPGSSLEPEDPEKAKRKRGPYKSRKKVEEEDPRDKMLREMLLEEDPYTGPVI